MYKIRNFHEGHSTVGEWKGSGRVVAGERHGMCESVFNTAGERHGMCESAFIIKASRSHSDTPHSVGLLRTINQPDAETFIKQHTTLTTDIQVSCGIRTRIRSKRTAADPHLRP
jgi:hypothetical protein